MEDFGRLRERMVQFEQHLHHALNDRTSSAAVAVQSYRDAVSQLRTRQRVLIDKLEELKELEIKLQEDQKNAQRDAEGSRSRLGTFRIRQQQLQSQKSALVEESKELESLMVQKQREIDQRRAQLLRQRQKDHPEVKLYEELLGMRVDASQQGTLRFIFDHWDHENPLQECQLTLDVSGDQFVLLETVPPLESDEQKQELVERFNKNNDVRSFLIETRSILASRVVGRR
ncbi:hypothetical protein ZYGR_0W00340 [Zygosaccharomyces rouxii]|uniref:Kinetochore protein SPC25 n=2 Tax=Zygosaccharomyces rouxii TaxID=4956 RepID=C5DYZ5_ZYGRC|nr:uncharacterized protein ZYRO0F16962g [Zygosaccharomyces rouxii]KAH9201282.1 kinetochore protein SPC25 [Zygosaccharomyces rouxii]GAV50508.1 hypothetical protein ZYGR_0W00340 [Zygosaccharomyces rouxii]CAQ43368.1 Kinetochore protein SPC25 [Zygosaccharomyces rouxii]CAR29006.1 ZYRO0F16962p [Zygosaccharomyces rouxii]